MATRAGRSKAKRGTTFPRFAPLVAAGRLHLLTGTPVAMFLLTLGSWVWTTLLGAVVFRSMWGWFIVPLWPRPITYAEAAGILLIVGFLRGIGVTETPNRPWHFQSFMRREGARVAAFAIAWCIAAGFHVFLF